jgi:hypothetical protein
MERSFDQNPPIAAHVRSESSQTAVVWAPVFAGAVIALATSIIFLAVGSGMGFAAASPWPGAGASTTAFAVGAGVWLIVTQWLSSFLGGFVTGRLRTKWAGVHTHEVTFRDTAHGLLAWAVATALVAAVGLIATASTTGTATSAATTSSGYAAEMLFRSDNGTPINEEAATQAAYILARDGGATSDDRAYVANVVATQTGISRAEAQQRVDTAVTSVRQAVDKARKISSAVSFFTALSMLIGAFIASAAAAYGGAYRDKHADLAPTV